MHTIEGVIISTPLNWLLVQSYIAASSFCREQDLMREWNKSSNNSHLPIDNDFKITVSERKRFKSLSRKPT